MQYCIWAWHHVWHNRTVIIFELRRAQYLFGAALSFHVKPAQVNWLQPQYNSYPSPIKKEEHTQCLLDVHSPVLLSYSRNYRVTILFRLDLNNSVGRVHAAGSFAYQNLIAIVVCPIYCHISPLGATHVACKSMRTYTNLKHVQESSHRSSHGTSLFSWWLGSSDHPWQLVSKSWSVINVSAFLPWYYGSCSVWVAWQDYFTRI